MAWLSLIAAGICEAIGVLMIHQFHVKRNFFSLIFLSVSFGASFFLLTYAMQTLPMSTSYAIWTGMGAAGGALIGMIFYHESKDWQRIFFIALIICATIGLKLIS